MDRAEEAITEGRDAVRGLRSSTVLTNDLARAINALGEELATGESNPNGAVFHVGVEGTSREFHPISRDEIYRIASEAVRNAFTHARARQIEVNIQYGERQFRLRVRDDGKGIDEKFVNGDGRLGHYGLPGMRARAQLLGGKLTVWTELNRGTVLELSVPPQMHMLCLIVARAPRSAERAAGDRHHVPSSARNQFRIDGGYFVCLRYSLTVYRLDGLRNHELELPKIRWIEGRHLSPE
jgi:signal transduction histidine kinase